MQAQDGMYIIITIFILGKGESLTTVNIKQVKNWM